MANLCSICTLYQQLASNSEDNGLPSRPHLTHPSVPHWIGCLRKFLDHFPGHPIYSSFNFALNKIIDLEEKVDTLRLKFPGVSDDQELLEVCRDRLTTVAHIEGLEADLHPEEVKILQELHVLRRSTYERLIPFLPKCRIPPHIVQGPIKNLPSELARSFWAVIIGIDNYQDPQTSNLRGSVNDARAVYQYFINMGVPRRNMRLLVDLKATRAKILTALRGHLLFNKRVKRGHRIVFYYSGHGCSYDSSECFPTRSGLGGTIESICPSDRGTGCKQKVPDISDREINLIFQSISSRYGQRITAILDCCHAGGGTRTTSSTIHNEDDNLPRVRRCSPIQGSVKAMLLAADKARKRGLKSNSAFTETWTPDMSTHVLLAACQFDESAAEVQIGNEIRGYFTYRLLSILMDRNPAELTFEDVVSRVGCLASQTPVVFGMRKSSPMWFITDS